MLACDHVIAVEGAEIGTPEINLGLWPFMISAVIQRDIPRKIALDLMLTGKRVPVTYGEGWGFVNQVVPADELDAAVDRYAQEIRSKSPLIVALGKRSFYRGRGHGDRRGPRVPRRDADRGARVRRHDRGRHRMAGEAQARVEGPLALAIAWAIAPE